MKVMLNINKLVFIWAVLLFTSTSFVYAQNEPVKLKDSLNNKLLSKFSTELKEIDKQSVSDSIKKNKIQLELNATSNSDEIKRLELETKLKELNQKEELRLSEKRAKIDSLRSSAKSFPVIGFFNDTLFLVYSNLGSFSAADRAEAVTERINKLTRDFTFNENTLKVVEAETTADIIFNDLIITSVSENDAIWNNSTKHELALTYKLIITDAVLHYKSETSVITLAKEVGSALLVILLLVVLLVYSKKLFKYSATKIISQRDKALKGLIIKNYTLLDSRRLVSVILLVNKIVKWLVFFILTYIALPIIFGFFPWTQNFAETLFGYVFNPLKKMGLGFWNYLPNLFTIIVIIFVFRYALRGIHFLKNEIENGKLTLTGFYPDWANPTFQILRVVLYAFMFVLIFPYLPGSDSPVFQGVSVFLGFLFTFGSAGSLSNIVAGIVLTYMRLFKVGDRVKIGEVVGDVIEKSMLVTRIRTIKNEIISIPNSTVMSNHTINYNNDAEIGKGLIMHTTVTIGYDVPWQDIHQALLNAADRTPHFLKEPKPFVMQTSLEDFYVAYQINAYTLEPNKQADIYSDLHRNIQDCCNEMGIEIMSPHYRAARDGNMTTIPANYLDKDYEMPAFKVNLKDNNKDG